MANYNRVILAGHLTRDPELRYLQSGSALCKFGVGYNRPYIADGKKCTETSFFEIEVWGKRAELINKHFAKGKPILLEGRMKEERWESKDGQKRSRVVVVMESFEFLNPSLRRGEDAPEHEDAGPDLPEQL